MLSLFSKPYRLYWALILLLGLALRLYRVNLPLLESQPNRQVIDAFIIRELSRPGQPLQTDFSIIGLPLYHLVVAGFYWLTGGENLMWGKLVSVFASLVNVVLLVKLIRLFASEKTSIIAAFIFFVLSPINIYLSRSIQIDEFSLVAGLAALYTLALWYVRKRSAYYWWSLVFFTLTLAQHATLAYLALPLLALFYLHLGKSFLKSPRVWLYFLVSLLVSSSWYFIFMVRLNESLPKGGWAEALDPRIWVNVANFISLKFWANNFYHFQEWGITSIGVVLFVLGLFGPSTKTKTLFLSWVLGALLSILYRSRPAILTHYYFFAFVPPAAVIAAEGLKNVFSRLSKSRYQFFLPILLGAIAVLVTWKTYVFNLYEVSPKHVHVLEASEKVKELVPQEASVIATSYSSIILQFYMDRAGHSLVIIEEPPTKSAVVEEFERLKAKGAEYYVIADKTELEKDSLFKAEINRYQRLYEDEYVLIVSLKNT